MSVNRRCMLGAILLTLVSGCVLVSSNGRAAQSCAEKVERTKQRTGTVNAPMPHMGVAARYVAAAQEALRNGDEAKCFEELSKTEKWLRMNSSHRGSR